MSCHKVTSTPAASAVIHADLEPHVTDAGSHRWRLTLMEAH